MAPTDSLTAESNISKTEEPPTAESKFMTNVCDDLLSEILIRLDCRSAIHCSSVFKRWFSQIWTPEFIRRFINRHQQHQQQFLDSNSSPYTFLFQSKLFQQNSFWPRELPEIAFHQLYCKKSKILHRGIRLSALTSSDYLNFLPEPMLVMAWFEDLLLVSPSIDSKDFYLCNPLTRQWHALPLAPRIGRQTKYSLQARRIGVQAQQPRRQTVRIQIQSGVLYWLSDVAPTANRCAIIALDPFKAADGGSQWRFIDPPGDLNPVFTSHPVTHAVSRTRSVNLFLGACRVRLRLALLPVKESDGSEVLRVWEMKDYNDDDNDNDTKI
ncbi:hypothetical protein TIFTF001_035941 [Ficus carica]|uniref:F-box domain-containing protein n=1 Tax=Ficus carica TaxID=3494 RepID=A0AA88E2F7_FICCA|nr:hypothetical protein TIFTF001_035941 [Ficus carica]